MLNSNVNVKLVYSPFKYVSLYDFFTKKYFECVFLFHIKFAFEYILVGFLKILWRQVDFVLKNSEDVYAKILEFTIIFLGACAFLNEDCKSIISDVVYLELVLCIVYFLKFE